MASPPTESSPPEDNSPPLPKNAWSKLYTPKIITRDGTEIAVEKFEPSTLRDNYNFSEDTAVGPVYLTKPVKATLPDESTIVFPEGTQVVIDERNKIVILNPPMSGGRRHRHRRSHRRRHRRRVSRRRISRCR